MVALVNDGFLLEGTAYFNRLNSLGAYTGIVVLPGLAKLEIKTNSDIKEQISKDKGQYGQITASVAIAKPAELTISLSNGTKDGIALAMMGSSSTLNSGSGTVTAEAVTASLGKFTELANQNIASGSVVVKNSAGTVTYVEGTDYEVAYALGLFSAKTGGAITDAQSIKVDYGYNAIAGWAVQGATTPQAKGRLLLDGRNLVNNKTVKFEAYSVLLTSNGAFDLMGDKFGEFSMTGRMETPSGKNEPFTIKQW